MWPQNTLSILLSWREAYFFILSVISGLMACFPNRIWQKWCHVQSRAWASTGLALLPLLSGYAAWWELGKETGRSKMENQSPKLTASTNLQKGEWGHVGSYSPEDSPDRCCCMNESGKTGSQKEYTVTTVSQLVLELVCYAAIANKTITHNP